MVAPMPIQQPAPPVSNRTPRWVWYVGAVVLAGGTWLVVRSYRRGQTAGPKAVAQLSPVARRAYGPVPAGGGGGGGAIPGEETTTPGGTDYGTKTDSGPAVTTVPVGTTMTPTGTTVVNNYGEYGLEKTGGPVIQSNVTALPSASGIKTGSYTPNWGYTYGEK